MAESTIVVGSPKPSGSSFAISKSERYVAEGLGVVGWILVGVGIVDIGLVWYPFQSGSPEFEFASVASSLNSFPVLVVGFGLLMATAGYLDLLGRLRLAVGFLVALLLAMAVGLVLFALATPLALNAEVDPALLTGIKKQLVKTYSQFVFYGIGLTVVVGKGIKYLGSKATA